MWLCYVSLLITMADLSLNVECHQPSYLQTNPVPTGLEKYHESAIPSKQEAVEDKEVQGVFVISTENTC